MKSDIQLKFVDILAKYSCGDNSRGTDKAVTHSYGDIYERSLSAIRKSARRMLEIGVYAGASCQVFSEYFDDIIVDGIDTSLEYVAFGIGNDRIRLSKLDGTKDDAPKVLGERMYDLIVDDASHLASQQLKSMRIFVPYLNPGGIYIVEDIQDGNSYIEDFLGIALKHGLVMSWYDLRDMKKRYDDIIAVFHK